MSTIRCPQCNLVNWATAAECKRCRFVFQTNEPPVFQTAPAGAGGYQTTQNPFTPPNYSEPAHQPSPFQKPPSNYQQQNNGYNNYQQPNNSYGNYQQPNNGYGGYQQPGTGYAYNNYQPGYHQPSQNLKSGLAVASMVLGILGIVTALFLVGFIFAPIGFILSIVALVKVRKKPHEYGGKGFAIAGLVTSLGVLPIFLIVMAIAIPNMMAARKAANEGSAISSLRAIAGANPAVQTTYGQTQCMTLNEAVF